MTVATVELKGEGIIGYHPEIAHGSMRAAFDAGQPVQVKLGRVSPIARPMCPQLEKYTLDAPVPPETLDYYTKAMQSINQMLGNDQYGDCVIASTGHAAGVWSFADNDSGGGIVATTQESLNAYHAIGGPGDNGLVITDAMAYWRDHGIVFGGKKTTIDGYASLDWRNKPLMQSGVLLTGTVRIGINLPNAWLSQAIWDVTTSYIVGGHDVRIMGWNKDGFILATWGGTRLLTWAAAASTMWLEEAYVELSNLWYGTDKKAPNGFDLATLVADMQLLNSGTIPPLNPTPDPPTPPVPPVPPMPPTPPVTSTLMMTGMVPSGWTGHLVPVTFTGTSIPNTAHGLTAGVHWIAVLGDLNAIMTAFNANDLNGTIAAIEKLFVDLGINIPVPAAQIASGLQARMSAGTAAPNYWVLLMDGFAIFTAIQSRDIPAIEAAVMKLLADLGVATQPLPHGR